MKSKKKNSRARSRRRTSWRLKKGSSSYIKRRKEAFARKVHKAMVHKIIYSAQNQAIEPTYFQLAGTPGGAIGVIDTAIANLPGTGMSDRTGSHIDVLYQRWGFRIYAYVPGREVIGQVPLNNPGSAMGVFVFLVYASKGQFPNLLANINNYFVPGGVLSGNAVATACQTQVPQWYDPNLCQFFIKKVKQVRLPCFSSTEAIPNNPPIVWDSHRCGTQCFVWHFRQTQKWKYANNASEAPLTERPLLVIVNNYSFAIQIEFYNKTVFVDAN